MNAASPVSHSRAGEAAYLTLGFGTAVAMWTVGYVCRLPYTPLPSPLLLAILLGLLAAGGFTAARLTGDGWKAGALTGALAAFLDLLVLGGLVTGDAPNQVVPSAALWLPGSLLAGAAIGALGGVAAGVMGGSRTRNGSPSISAAAWTSAFAHVAVVATGMLIVVGGLVTSHGAGLAVVDWPNSFGYAMFLYPLSRMTGGVYFEHAHRLFGSLVGLTTLVLTVHLWRVDRRRSVRWLAVAALVAVIAQGILGGLRVTGKFTTTTSPEEVAPNLALAAVHGTFAQIFLGMLVGLAILTHPRWVGPARPRTDVRVATDRRLWILFAVLLVAQIVVGSILRHFSGALTLHIVGACAVLGLALAVGLRTRAHYAGLPELPRAGGDLAGLVGFQFALGLAALVATVLAKGSNAPPAYEIWITTAHQATGALIVALTARTLLWMHRLVSPA